MDTNIKILIGVVVVVILLIIGILVFKHHENFENFSNPSENFHKYIHHLYHAINQTIIPDFHNANRTTDITQSQDIPWPPTIQNKTTIENLNNAYNHFTMTYKDDIDKLTPLYLSTDSVAYTSAYNKLVNTLGNMAADPNQINVNRLNARIVLRANPDILAKLKNQYGKDFDMLYTFVQDTTPF
jgi:hypothetical protein